MMLMATKMVISKMVDDDGNGEGNGDGNGEGNGEGNGDGNGEGHQIIDKKEECDDHPRNKKSCSSLTIMMIKNHDHDGLTIE